MKRFWAAVALLLTACGLPFAALSSEETSAFSRALAAYQDRKLEEAYRYAAEAVAEEPRHVDAHLLLGELYYLRQELLKALAELEQAAKLAPSRTDIQESLAKVRKELKVEKDLARSDTHPFVVRFAEGQTPVDLGELKQLLRDTHRLVGQSFQYFPAYAITVILYPEEDFEKVKGVGHQVAGLYDGKIRLPLTRNLQATGVLKAVLWHEYTHVLVHDLAKGKCPTWLNEGIATYQEARVRPPDLSQTRLALRKGALPGWEALWREQYTGSTAALQALYGQGYLIVQFLVKKAGVTGLVSLLTRLSWGIPISDALKAEYHVDPAALEKEWLAWVKRL
ncbi:MAG: hypothetical protein HYS41_02670 [Candidatus Omnitrophica bacterium]|nr:hypothetical protein [Candidatus Omnitrophota bacterium]